jgi:hypothetical protein
MRIGEFSRVRALPRRLDFDETDKRVIDADGVIGPRLQMAERRLADERQPGGRQIVEVGEIADQPLQRRPQLIFRRPRYGGIVQLGAGLGAKGRNHAGECRLLQRVPESCKNTWRK